MAASSAAAGGNEHSVLARRVLQGSRRLRAQGRYCILEAKPLSYHEDRGNKLRKDMLRPKEPFCVGARRGDSKPGDLRPLCHVNPGPFFRYPTVPLTRCLSLAELAEPCRPSLLARVGLSSLADVACAGTDLTGSVASIHPCLLLSRCGADNSYIPSTALWFLSSFGSPCAKYC